jgi:pyruvate dehydrogenase E1 component
VGHDNGDNPKPGSKTVSDHNDVTTGRTLDQLPDPDPRETMDWLDSLTDVVKREGSDRARFLLRRVLEHAGSLDVDLSPLISSDYVNTIPSSADAAFPGNEEVERRLLAIVRWNAAAIVSRANKPELGLGGHMASYASAAELFEVGFNHFFRGKDGGHGDQVFFQGHSSPGVYARAFLEGRLSEEQLDRFRQETRPGGLPSYPHPRLMPEFWEFPTVSMGLGAINAIYQARFNRYLGRRGIVDSDGSRVWAFLGDGEMDEPEAVGALSVAARDELDNLTFVINCNLQRLDGPVRGNGKIVQELEALFRGAGWNVVKVLWGRLWDPLLERDTSGALVAKLNALPDGELQTLAAENAGYIREHLFDSRPLRELVDSMPDEEVVALSLDRGGHDIRKVHAAYNAAVEHKGQPTVVIAQSIKGRGLGPEFEARNATHQMKKFVRGTLNSFRDRLGLDIPDEQLADGYPPYYRPPADSDLHSYLMERRRELGGPVPRRVVRPRPLELPGKETYARLKNGSGRQPVATTMALVRLVKDLLRHPDVGRRIVPIIPDEARTFGMDSLFPDLKIYSVRGMTYDAVDRELVLSYKEDTHGQILHEGITEAGSMSEFHAAGSSYATFGEPMIPVYVFYSMFGFQRTGDLAWSAADQRCRGFLIGATAGRTTLNGEGLQHQDGHSLLLASANPACEAYDPSFGFEIPVIVEDALRRMYGERPEDVFYYLTVYNEPLVQPPIPNGLDESLIVRGLYRYRAAEGRHAQRAQLVTSGSAMPAALRAQELLAGDFDVAADVWSAPGWQRLRREALECEEWNRMHPTEEPRVPLVNRAFAEVEGPIVAVTDFMRAIPDQIARWVPRPYTILGTDGFGRSDTRPALRRHFKIDAENIVVAVLQELALADELKRETVAEAIARYGLDPESTTEVP